MVGWTKHIFLISGLDVVWSRLVWEVIKKIDSCQLESFQAAVAAYQIERREGRMKNVREADIFYGMWPRFHRGSTSHCQKSGWSKVNLYQVLTFNQI